MLTESDGRRRGGQKNREKCRRRLWTAPMPEMNERTLWISYHLTECEINDGKQKCLKQMLRMQNNFRSYPNLVGQIFYWIKKLTCSQTLSFQILSLLQFITQHIPHKKEWHHFSLFSAISNQNSSWMCCPGSANILKGSQVIRLSGELGSPGVGLQSFLLLILAQTSRGKNHHIFVMAR